MNSVYPERISFIANLSMDDQSPTGPVLEQLIEMAKAGILTKDYRQSIAVWLRHYDLEVPDEPEAGFLKILATELILKKGASEPTPKIPDPVTTPPEELLPAADHFTARIMREIIRLRDTPLLEECLLILKHQKKRLPPWVLPFLLDECQTTHEIHRLMDDTMGFRGDWLAALRTEWQWWLTLKNPVPDANNTSSLSGWIAFHRHYGTDLLPAFHQLPAKDRKYWFERFIHDPHNHYEAIARAFLHSRSAAERSLARTLLLRLPTSERQTVLSLLQPVINTHIKSVENQLHFRPVRKIPSSNSSLLPEEFMLHSDQIKDNPGRMLTLIPPQSLFGHLDLPVKTICRALMEQAGLQDLYQITLCAACQTGTHPDWVESLCLDWIVTYPEGNTTQVDVTPLWESISPDLYQKLVATLIRDTGEYFIAKLTLLTGSTRHYIKRDLSEQLVTRIFRLPETQLNRRDFKDLSIALSHLQYRLDPRIYNIVNQYWVEPSYPHGPLNDAFWQFRNTLRTRSELLTAILNS